MNQQTLFVKKLDELCALIERSEHSIYAHFTVNETIQILKNIKSDVIRTSLFDKTNLDILLAPTGSIQEISIANGWEQKFLQLAQEIDELARQLLDVTKK